MLEKVHDDPVALAIATAITPFKTDKTNFSKAAKNGDVPKSPFFTRQVVPPVGSNQN